MRIIMLLLLGGIILFSACRKDPVKGCTDNAALNYNTDAEKDDGTCTYERDKFVGSYRGNHACAQDLETEYKELEIEKSTDNTNRILLKNYPLSGSSLYGQIDADPQRFIIPPQSYVVELDSSYISGDGELIADSLFIRIYREHSSGLDTCDTKVRKMN